VNPIGGNNSLVLSTLNTSTLTAYYTSGVSIDRGVHTAALKAQGIGAGTNRDPAVIPPWEIPNEAADDELLRRIFSSDPIIDTDDPLVHGGDNEELTRLFTLWRGLSRLRDVAQYAETGKQADYQRTALESRFSGYLEDLVGYADDLSFVDLTLLSWSPDGRYLLIANAEGLWIWDDELRKAHQIFANHHVAIVPRRPGAVDDTGVQNNQVRRGRNLRPAPPPHNRQGNHSCPHLPPRQHTHSEILFPDRRFNIQQNPPARNRPEAAPRVLRHISVMIFTGRRCALAGNGLCRGIVFRRVDIEEGMRPDNPVGPVRRLDDCVPETRNAVANRQPSSLCTFFLLTLSVLTLFIAS